MKKISLLMPTFNEEENIGPIIAEAKKELEKLEKYDYEIVIIDNHSTDNTRKLLEQICSNDPKVKAIFNERNFGGIKSPIHGLLQITGDCVVILCADFQDPVELIPKFVGEWEKGYEVVCGVKIAAKEFFLMRGIRKLAYIFLNKFSKINVIKHFDGVGLYDRSFIEKVREVVETDKEVQLRTLIPELGSNYTKVYFTHQRRRAGKSKEIFIGLYPYGINMVTTYTKVFPRISLCLGIILGIISLIMLIGTGIFNIARGFTNTLVIYYFASGISLMFSMVLFFIGILGEYIMAVNDRVMNRPLVLEEKRLNF